MAQSSPWWLTGVLFMAQACFAAPAADPLVELRRLSTDGHADRALAQLPGMMAARPDDPRLPFEKALLLTSQKRVEEAIGVYERMVKTWPDLPEPLNNLGVLYAASGDLDRARSAFEAALNLQQPAHTAYSNLGQVNMRLAGKAYARALRIDDGPKALALAPIQHLPDSARPVEPGGAAASTAAADLAPSSGPQVLAAAPAHPYKLPPAPLAPSSPLAASSAAAVAVAAASGSRTVAASTPPTASVPAASTAKPTSPPDIPASRDVQLAIAAWATAWSQKNLEAYFAAYVPGYKGNDTNAVAWQTGRKLRILGKSHITVGVSRVTVVLEKDGNASASFRQTYVADQLNVSSSKTLEFVRQGGKWLIRKELAGS